jgi:hypothetical protein
LVLHASCIRCLALHPILLTVIVVQQQHHTSALLLLLLLLVLLLLLAAVAHSCLLALDRHSSVGSNGSHS